MHAITGQKGIELYAPNGYCGAYNEIGTIGLRYTKTGRETQWATKTTQSMVGKVTNKDDRCGAVFTSNKSQIIIDPAGLVVVKQFEHIIIKFNHYVEATLYWSISKGKA